MSDNQTCPHCGEQNDAPATNDIAAERPRNKTKITCLVVFILFAVVGFMMLKKAVFEAREAARRLQCMGHLKQISLAMLNYHEKYKCFPPAYIADDEGRPMHSWRVLVLPFMNGSNDFYNTWCQV